MLYVTFLQVHPKTTGRRETIEKKAPLPRNYKQYFKFLISGGLNVLATFGLFWLLVDFVGLVYPLASVVTWLAGITINFFLMWFWVFSSKSGVSILRAQQRHFGFHLLYYLCNLALLILFTELTGAHPIAVQAVLLVFLLPLNFLGTKYFVMRNGSPMSSKGL